MKSILATLLGASALFVSAPAFADGPEMPSQARMCGTCHNYEPGGRPKMGPELTGVFGRTAGTLEGFNYSPAMANSGIVWDAETLDAYLANPRTNIPGNRMSFAGIRDEAQRAAVIEWLEYVTTPAAE